MHSAVQQIEEEVDRLGANAGTPGGERVRTQQQDRGGTVILARTTAPAPTIDPVPMTQPPTRTEAWPMRTLFSMTLECTSALCPMVTSSPTIVGSFSSVWMVELSCTFDRAPISMRSMSPRSTVPNHTDACSWSVTSPMSTAVGATNAVGCTGADFPLNAYSGTHVRYSRDHHHAEGRDENADRPRRRSTPRTRLRGEP